MWIKSSALCTKSSSVRERNLRPSNPDRAGVCSKIALERHGFTACERRTKRATIGKDASLLVPLRQLDFVIPSRLQPRLHGEDIEESASFLSLLQPHRQQPRLTRL